MNKTLLCVCVPVIAADQAVKAAIRGWIPGQTLFEIPGVVAITPSFNTGAAFSLFSGHPFLLAGVSAVMLIAICVFAARAMRLTRGAMTAICFMIGGGVSNLIDRVIHGGVTDYIRLLMVDFPVFNLADIAITCSGVVLLVLLMTGRLEYTTGEEYGSDHRNDG